MSNGARGRSRFTRFLAAAVGLLIALPAILAIGAEPVPDRMIVHLLNRLAFGPTLEEVRRQDDRDGGLYCRAARSRYIDAGADRAAVAARPLDTLRLNPVQLRQLYGPLRSLRGFKPSPELERAQRERVQIILRDASEARILRALLSPRQLNEVMVDFWFNHFNVFSGKGLDDVSIGNYEQQAIRPFVLGQFRDLLFATTKHPAMLVYLDNALSTAPGSPGARGRQKGLNENFAREVMELHTLGANGGYTQEDVVALARVLTGWGVNHRMPASFPNTPRCSKARATITVQRFSSAIPSRRAARQRVRRRSTSWLTARRPRVTSRSSWRNILSPTSRLRGWSTGSRHGSSRPTATSGGAEDAFRQPRILGQRAQNTRRPTNS